MRAACIGWPGAMISSPVERMATIGLRQTSTVATPIAASTPVSRLVRTLSASQNRLAGGDVGAGERDAAAGGHRAADVDVMSGFSRTLAPRARGGHDIHVLDHDDGVGTARHHPAGGDRDGPPASNDCRSARRPCESLHRQAGRTRDLFGCAECVLRNHGEAVDVRAIERRHVHRASTSAARSRPSAASSGTRSTPRGRRSMAARKRRSASSRSRTWRNCSCPDPPALQGGSRIEPDIDFGASGEAFAVVAHDDEAIGSRSRGEHRGAGDRERLDSAIFEA